MPTGAKSNMVNGSPMMSSRMRETMMLGEVPTSVASPPSSDPKDSGISRRDAGLPVRREIWNAIGMKIASAPIFFMKADSTVTDAHQDADLRTGGLHVRGEGPHHQLDDAGAADGGAHHQGRADDDHDIVAEAAEGLVGRDDAAGYRGEQGSQRHDVVADPVPDQQPDHDDDDGESRDLAESH